MKAILDVIVCVDSFKTIDLLLLQEGMYQLRFSIYLQSETAKIPLTPKETFLINDNLNPSRTSYHAKKVPTDRQKKTQIQQFSNKDWVPQHILKEYNMYCTQAFLIRSWTEEEKIKIQNGARFTAVLPISYLSVPMIMEVELMFYELTNPKIAKFKSISITRYRIENYATGVYEYIPIVFNEDHFHLLNLTLYSTILDFKLKKNDQIEGNQFQTSQLKSLYSQFVAPLRQAYINLNEFVNHMETDVDRKSASALSTRYSIRNILPSSCLRDLDKRNYEPDILTKQVATEFQIVESQLNSLWLKMISLIKTKNPQYIRTLKKESIINHQLRFSQFTHREVIQVIDHIHTTEPEQQKVNQDKQECQQKRDQYQQQDLNNTLFLAINNGLFGPSKIIDLKIIKEVKDKLVILEKHYQTSKFKQEFTKIQSGKIHLIVFVHGYQGHPFDMRLFENYLCMRFPSHMFMISISNQQTTEGDIMQMGLNLANEVIEFITQWCPDNQLHKISFVAHSLGGLIVRASLPHLNEYADKCYTLITLGSPHIGYVHNDHGLIKFGLWILQVFKKSQCLQQLTLKDNKEEDELCLMKLSKMPGLGWFKNIIFIGSKQDHYVSQESALIMKMSSVSSSDLHNKLANNILKHLNQSEIVRVNVDFKFQDGDVDTFLGRKAHIAILESHFLIQYIIYNLGDYLR